MKIRYRQLGEGSSVILIPLPIAEDSQFCSYYDHRGFKCKISVADFTPLYQAHPHARETPKSRRSHIEKNVPHISLLAHTNLRAVHSINIDRLREPIMLFKKGLGVLYCWVYAASTILNVVSGECARLTAGVDHAFQ